jgi:hypothetical protein
MKKNFYYVPDITGTNLNKFIQSFWLVTSKWSFGGLVLNLKNLPA